MSNNPESESKAKTPREDFLDILEWTLQALSYDYTGEGRTCLYDMAKILEKPASLGWPKEMHEDAVNSVESALDALLHESRNVRKALWHLWKLHHKVRLREPVQGIKQPETAVVATGAPYHIGKLAGPNILHIGNMHISYMSKNTFFLNVPSNQALGFIIYEAEVTDVIKFMLHHFKPCFPGSIQKESDAA